MSKVAQITEITGQPARVVFSDFFSDFSRNAVTGELNKKTNVESVKQSVKNLLLTDKYERLFQPEVGSGLKGLLFENATPFVQLQIESYITAVIENYEPRARIIATNVSFYNDRNAANITIKF
jgi:phage baseplate assembly protein W